MHIVRFVAVPLVLVATASAVVRQSVNDDTVWRKVSDALRAVYGSGTVLLCGSTVLDPWMDEGVVANRAALAALLDTTFDGSECAGNGSHLSAVYLDVLEHAQWALSTLTADQRKQLAAAKRTLYSDAEGTVPAAAYSRYLDLKTAADDLQKRWDDTPEEQRSAALANDLQDAKQDLALFDENGKYSLLAQVVQSLSGRPLPVDIGSHLRQQYEAGAITLSDGRRFASSDLGSGYARTVENDAWTTLDIMSGQDDAAGQPPFSLRFDVAFVAISRPWFEPSLFGERFWRWSEPGHSPVTDPSQPPGSRGQVPSYASHAIVVSNIVIGTSLSEARWRAIRDAALAGGTATWGPFAVAGRYFDPQHRPFAARRVGGMLRIADVQIIGWLIEDLPKSPNPDARLEWPAPGSFHPVK